MISLGIIDIVIAILFVIVVFFTTRNKLYGWFYLAVFIFVVYLIERLLPGILAQISNAMQAINRLNDAGPHLSFNPVITFK